MPQEFFLFPVGHGVVALPSSLPKTVEVPKGQHMDRIVDVTLVLQHQVPTSQTVQNTVEVSSVPAEVIDVCPGSLVSARLITARTVGTELRRTAMASIEAAALLNCQSTAYVCCCEFGMPGYRSRVTTAAGQCTQQTPSVVAACLHR